MVRKMRWMLLVVLAGLAAAAVVPLLSQPGGAATMQPDYRAYLIQTYDELTQEFTIETMRKRLRDPRRLTIFASMAMTLYEQTGNEKYLAQAELTFRTLMSEWKAKPELYKSHDNMFFVLEPLLFAYEGLKKKGKVSEEQEAIVKAYLPIATAQQLVDNNQGLSRAVGTAEALRLFPDNPQAEVWKANIDELWNYWYRNRDLDENAGNYNAIGLSAMVRLAELTGKTDSLKDGAIRAVFERYRDQLSPMGAMPEYGDDYFGEWENWVFVFEYAARLYNDPTFIEAAHKAFAFGTRNNPFVHKPGKFDEDWWSIVSLHEIADLIKLPASSLKPAETKAASKVQLRNEPGNPGTADKLALTPSHLPGSPFAVMELYGRGYHGHTNRIGAIVHYETDNVPLFHGLSRHNRSAVDGNIVAMLPGDESFPHPQRTGVPGVWNHESVPVRSLVAGSTQDNDPITLDQVTIRLDGKQDVSFVIDNLRLEGPAGVLYIDKFDTLEQWDRKDKPFAIVQGASESDKALQIAVKPGASVFYNAKGYSLSFSMKQYTTIRYDWTYRAPVKSELDFVFRLWVKPKEGVPYHVDTYPGDVNIVPHLADVAAEMKGNDSFGIVRLNEYGTFDSSLTRKLVLLREGVLAIVDELTTGAHAAGNTIGPIWHLYSLGEKGDNWFDSPGESRTWFSPDREAKEGRKSLLVYYGKAEGRTYGAEEEPMASGMKPYTTFARQKAAAGGTTRFVTVLVPHRPDLSGAELARTIHVNDLDGVVRIGLTVPGTVKPVTIEVGAGASKLWSVSR